MNKQPLRHLGCIVVCSLFGSATALASVDIADTSQIVVFNITPNLLLIPDTSESMQEGLSQGRPALNWADAQCSPGPAIDASCVSGAAYSESKASIVKRVSRELISDYFGKMNIGLLSYQQYPPSHRRNDVFPGFEVDGLGTSRWRLMHRIVDARFSLNPTPGFYQPTHTEPWNSSVKRFREPHPNQAGAWIFYNVAVTGYHRESVTNWETQDRSYFCQYTGNNFIEGDFYPYSCFNDVVVGDDDSLSYENAYSNFQVTLTDSMRQRGVTNYGQNLIYLQLNQTEWRANASPGLGYLHVPIGGIDADGQPVDSHRQRLLQKLNSQRHDWVQSDGNVFTNDDWPLTSAGLTPLEGTMRTARDYFLKQTSNFGSAQGNTGDYIIPESCGINAAIWITDGLPSVRADGTALGTNPVQAMRDAADAIRDLFDATSAAPVGAVKTYVVGFALPPGVSQLFSGQDGFTTDNPLDILAAAGGTERAIDASDESSLQKALNDIFRNVINESISSSGIASTSTELSTETAVFQSEMNTLNWSGELLSLSVSSGGRDRANPNWRAGHRLTEHLASGAAVAARNVVGSQNGIGFAFTTADTPSALKSTHGLTDAIINYIRGSQVDEQGNGGSLRNRSGLLGHIVNSTPLYVPGDGGRPPMLYVMANDGMLHAFHAGNGDELFAFIPEVAMPKLPLFASPDYAGQFLLDGQLAAVKVGGQKILVGSAGLAGKSVFALNISNPNNFSFNDVLWEKSGSDAFDGLLGVSISDLRVVQYDGQPVIAMGNGYNSVAGKSALLLINPLNGNLSHRFEVDGSGFGSPGLLDFTRNGNTDFIYVGDYNGKLWRFLLNSSLDWDHEHHLFTADANRPITAAPVIGSHPNGGVMIVFGSGELLSTGSRSSTATEFVYGIRDRFDTNVSHNSFVVEQEIIQIIGNNRYTSQHVVNESVLGWKFRLPPGERVMSSAVIRGSRVLFGSYRPDNEPCSGGGAGYYTQLNLFSGTPLHSEESSSQRITIGSSDGNGNGNGGTVSSAVPRTPIILRPPAEGHNPVCPDGDCSPIPGDRDLVLIGEEDRLVQFPRGRQQWREIGR